MHTFSFYKFAKLCGNFCFDYCENAPLGVFPSELDFLKSITSERVTLNTHKICK